ncbi:MAG: hypothetical protein ACWA41_04235 [Putridiphycobacter sp.]
MNKVVNIFTLGFLFLFSFLVVGNYEDIGISVYEIDQIKFLKEISIGIIVVVALLGFIRIKRRWVGVKDIKAFNKFEYVSPLSKKAKTMVVMFGVMEIVFLSFFVALFLKELPLDIDHLLLPMMGILLLLILEIIAFTLYSFNAKNVNIIGINKNLITYFDREIHIVFFDGLQRISIYQNRLHFKYKLDLNIFVELDFVPKENLLTFKAELEKVLLAKGVFIDDSYRLLGQEEH